MGKQVRKAIHPPRSGGKFLACSWPSPRRFAGMNFFFFSVEGGRKAKKLGRGGLLQPNYPPKLNTTSLTTWRPPQSKD